MEMPKIIPAFLFGPVSYWKHMLVPHDLMIGLAGAFPKQTHRNRFEISAPNKRQVLSVPVLSESRKLGCSEVRIAYKEPWQREHQRSIEAAYRASPYYEMYANEVFELLCQPHEYLMDLNVLSLQWVAGRLKCELSPVMKNAVPNRYDNELIVPIKQTYFQNFSDRRPFDNNVSILDLLFQIGPEALGFLERELRFG